MGSAKFISAMIPGSTSFQRLDNGDIGFTYPEGRFKEVKVEPTAKPFVVFGEQCGVQAKVRDLSTMYEFVRDDLIPRFTRFFVKPKGS